MIRSGLLVLAMLTAPGALAEERTPGAAPDERDRPHGLLSHGDSSAFMEDFFGGRVERPPPETPGARRKHDPAIRWEGPATATK